MRVESVFMSPFNNQREAISLDYVVYATINAIGGSSKWNYIPNGIAYTGANNVGIGTSTPTAKLEVNGNIIANTPTAANHVATKAYVDANGGGL